MIFRPSRWSAAARLFDSGRGAQEAINEVVFARPRDDTRPGSPRAGSDGRGKLNAGLPPTDSSRGARGRAARRRPRPGNDRACRTLIEVRGASDALRSVADHTRQRNQIYFAFGQTVGSPFRLIEASSPTSADHPPEAKTKIAQHGRFSARPRAPRPSSRPDNSNIVRLSAARRTRRRVAVARSCQSTSAKWRQRRHPHPRSSRLPPIARQRTLSARPLKPSAPPKSYSRSAAHLARDHPPRRQPNGYFT